MAVLKRVVLSLVFSIFIFSLVAGLALSGIPESYSILSSLQKILLFVSIFLVLFFIFFLILSIKRGRALKEELFPSVPPGQKKYGLLRAAENCRSSVGVVLERDGIHFISDSAKTRDSAKDDNLDSDFKKLVESVVGDSQT